MSLFEIHSLPVDEYDLMSWDPEHCPSNTERVGYIEADSYEDAVKACDIAIAQGTWLPQDAHILPQENQA